MPKGEKARAVALSVRCPVCQIPAGALCHAMSPGSFVELKNPHKARVRRGAGFKPATWKPEAALEAAPDCDLPVA